jgi:hypothetical protein
MDWGWVVVVVTFFAKTLSPNGSVAEKSERAHDLLLFEHRNDAALYDIIHYIVRTSRVSQKDTKHSVAEQDDSERYIIFPVVEGSIRSRQKFWLFPKRHKRRARAI